MGCTPNKQLIFRFRVLPLHFILLKCHFIYFPIFGVFYLQINKGRAFKSNCTNLCLQNKKRFFFFSIWRLPILNCNFEEFGNSVFPLKTQSSATLRHGVPYGTRLLLFDVSQVCGAQKTKLRSISRTEQKLIL